MELVERIDRLEKRIDELAARLGEENRSRPYVEAQQIPKGESPREFFLRFRPKTDTEKTLVATKFLENEGVQSITVWEIKDAFKRMREPVPPNVSDKIQLLDKRGLVQQAGQDGKRKCWKVSTTGEKYLRGLEEDGRS